MGSFWGMSQAGREAEGWPREYGAWSQGQFKNWLDRSDEQYAGGEAAQNWARAWAENRANQGIGAPGQMIEYGRQIMPGVDDYVSAKRGRLQDSIDRWGELPTWQDTMGRIDAANDANRQVNRDNLSYIDQTRNYALQDIGDTYGRGVGYEDTAYGKNVGDLTDRYNDLEAQAREEYGGLRQQNRDLFGGLRDKNRDVYGGLKASAEDTYGTALSDVDMLRPGSEFNIAQTARSFAPMMASTAGKLRRMGVDTASPQGLSAMQRVETARSRAMDDAAAEGTARYVDARTNLLGQRQAARERLGTGELTGDIGLGTDELGNEIGLGQDQNKLTTGLSVQQGEGLRGENTRHAGQLTGLDLTRSGRAIDTQNQAMDRITANQGREMDINDQGARNEMMRKAMATGDWDTMNQLQGRMSDAELEAIGLHRDEFNSGMGYRTADLGERNQGAAQVGDYGNRMLDYSMRGSGAAQGWGNTAEDAYRTAYGYEAPKAGYGVKMLASAAGAGLDMIAPGAGTALTGAFGGGYGGAQPGGYSNGSTGGYQYGQPSGGYPMGGGYNPQNPYGTGPYGTPPFVPNQPTGYGQPNMMQGLTNLYGTIGNFIGGKKQQAYNPPGWNASAGTWN